MSVELVTVEEFKLFQNNLNIKLDSLIDKLEKTNFQKKWLKSSEVMNMLSISHGTLQSLRNSGELPFSRIQGTLYYSIEDVENLLEENKSQPN